MEMGVIELDFECTHDTANNTMTCSWLGGRIRLIVYFEMSKTYLLIDGDVKCRYDDLTIDEFVRLQCECQRTVQFMDTKI